MKNEKKQYYDDPGECFAPIDSASYAAWLCSLTPGLRKVVIEENERRQKAAKIENK